ncbi:hypothetical protein WJX73_006249 [Symbiochloris irregularis]|uniref:Uncharacterized protein n=1 Tax=Symbiochloris irregularis TaxID=706552 RepID=A0AAW1PMW9_9CHLO
MASEHDALVETGSQQTVDIDRAQLDRVPSDSTVVLETRSQDGGSSSDTTDYHTDEDRAAWTFSRTELPSLRFEPKAGELRKVFTGASATRDGPVVVSPDGSQFASLTVDGGASFLEDVLMSCEGQKELGKVLTWSNDLTMALLSEPSQLDEHAWLPVLSRERHMLIVDVHTGETRRHLTTQVDKSIMCNYWFSPNDEYIAYNCTRPFGVNVISIAAGALCLHKDITMDAFEPCLPGSLPGFINGTQALVSISLKSLLHWSPDSATIVYPTNSYDLAITKVSNGDTIDVDLRQYLELQRPTDISADDEYYRCMASGVTIDVSPDSQFAFLALPHRISRALMLCMATGEVVVDIHLGTPTTNTRCFWRDCSRKATITGFRMPSEAEDQSSKFSVVSKLDLTRALAEP